MRHDATPGTVRLGDYVLLFRRQWAIVLVGVLVGLTVAAGYLLVAPRAYTSTTSVLVTPTTGGSSAGNRTPEINLDTEAQLVTSTDTVSSAAELLQLPAGEAAALADRVAVTVPPNTEILDISYTADTAEEARRGAAAFATAYLDARRATAVAALDAEYQTLQARVDTVNEQLRAATEAVAALPNGSPERARAADQVQALSQQLASLASQQNEVRSTAVSPGRVVTRPALPSAPSSPDVPVTLAGSALLGLLLGIGVAALRYRTDDCLRSAEDVDRRTGLPVIAELDQPLREGEVAVVAPSSPDGRAYARVRHLLTGTLELSARRVVLVAGIGTGGGPVAANLAASLARSGEDVHLVCTDTSGDTVGSLLRRPPATGLADVLAGVRTVAEVVHAVPGLPSLRVLGPGPDPDRADVLLQGRGLRAVLDSLAARGSYVVVEAPATDGPDLQTLAGGSDAALVIVERGRTTGREVADVTAQLASIKRPVLGAVLVSSDPRLGTDDVDGAEVAADGADVPPRADDDRPAAVAVEVTATGGPASGRDAARR